MNNHVGEKMITGKKLILLSVLALAIGISSIIPVGYFLVSSAQPQTFDEPWFNLTIPYTYWEAKNGTYEEMRHPDSFLMNESRLESLRHQIYLNYTLKADIQTEDIDARTEYFIIKLVSDKGIIQQKYDFFGTNINPSMKINDFKFSRDGWFDTSNMGGGGMLYPNMTLGESFLGESGGGTSGTIDKNSEVAKIRQADELFLKIYRIALVTFTENETIVTSTNDIVCNIQLEKYGDGWLYNNLISEDELPEVDLWSPVDLLEMMMK